MSASSIPPRGVIPWNIKKNAREADAALADEILASPVAGPVLEAWMQFWKDSVDRQDGRPAGDHLHAAWALFPQFHGK